MFRLYCRDHRPRDNRWSRRPALLGGSSGMKSGMKSGNRMGGVGLVGFEPTTSCSQSRRAAKLRHSPVDTHSRRMLDNDNCTWSRRPLTGDCHNIRRAAYPTGRRWIAQHPPGTPEQQPL